MTELNSVPFLLVAAFCILLLKLVDELVGARIAFKAFCTTLALLAAAQVIDRSFTPPAELIHRQRIILRNLQYYALFMAQAGLLSGSTRGTPHGRSWRYTVIFGHLLLTVTSRCIEYLRTGEGA